VSPTSASYGRGNRTHVRRASKVRHLAKRRKHALTVSSPLRAFESAFTLSLVPMLIADRNGQCVEANDNAAKLIKMRRSALLRRKLDDVFELPPPAPGGSIQTRILSGEVLDVEVRVRQKDAAPIRLRLRANSLDDDMRLISLTRIPDPGAKAQNTWHPSGSNALLEEFFPLPWGNEDTDFQALFQHSPYGICILQNDRIEVINPTFCKLLGYGSSEEIVGKEMRNLLDEGSRMFFSLLQHRVYRGETVPTRFETRMIRHGGSTIDVETSFAHIWYKGAPALNLSINDITDRKELEKRLTDSESLLRNVVNSMVDALVITDLQGKVLDVNDEFQRFTGFSRREAFGAEIPYPWVPEEDLRSYIGWLEKLRENNVLRDFDITWIRKGGDRIAVSLNTTLLRNASGEPVLMVNIARDISERQASREELSRQLQRLQVLYDLSSALTHSLDSEHIARITFQQLGKVIPVDRFFIDLYDGERKGLVTIFSVETVGGKRVEIPLAASRVALDKSLAKSEVISSRKPLLEFRDMHDQQGSSEADGSERSFASTLTVPMVSKEKTIGVLSVHSSRTRAYSDEHVTLVQSIAHLAGLAIEKAQLYEETIRKSREIESRNKELDDFTYVVSHDLKEPLISVEGYAKMMRAEYQESFDVTGMEYLQAVVDSCSHMKRLIDDLLLLSRVSKVSENRTTVSLSGLMSELLEELQFSIRDKKAQIVVQKDLPSVSAVDTHLRIVLRNLVSNALKFCDKPIPRIEIGATVNSEETTICVRDNGIGIEEAHFEKVFLIFQRLHKKDEYEGVGAGLTIVKKIVESHGGKIWLESTVGQGSAFYFTIPTV
jgi:PAS domain S-box-containing protein